MLHAKLFKLSVKYLSVTGTIFSNLFMTARLPLLSVPLRVVYPDPDGSGLNGFLGPDSDPGEKEENEK
jgi:hypothetical protein